MTDAREEAARLESQSHLASSQLDDKHSVVERLQKALDTVKDEKRQLVADKIKVFNVAVCVCSCLMPHFPHIVGTHSG